MHRIAYVVSVIIMMGGLQATAMDNDDSADNPLLSDEALVDLKKETLKAIHAYHTALVNSLGCCFERVLISIFEPQKHQPTLKNITFCTELSTAVKQCASAHSLGQHLTSVYERCTTSTTTSQEAFQFLRSLTKIITEIERESMESTIDDADLCGVCIERQKMIAGLPCGHMVCRICLTDLRNARKSTSCHTCLKKIENYVAITPLCTSCEGYKPDYIEQSGYPSLCTNCFEKNKQHAGSTTNTDSNKFYKVYY